MSEEEGVRERGEERERVGRPRPSDMDASRKLKIAYVSPDLRTHPIAFFLEPFLRHHDRSQVHVTCYSCGTDADRYSDRLRGLSDEWVSLAHMTAEAAAARLRADCVDIAVDLAGHHVVRSRGSVAPLDILAYYAAPVQVTWIGYPNTTGLHNVDYRFTDAIADPLESTQKYSEELVRLDNCFLCFAPPQELLDTDVAVPPFQDKENLHVTFGSFNDVSKNSPSAMRVWGKILAQVPSATLKIKVKDAGKYSLDKDRFTEYADRFVSLALDPPAPRSSFKSKANLRRRIEMLPWCQSLTDHFASYHQVDIALDPFPYSGTTTTLDALLMGVPVVTLRQAGPNARHAHNVTASLLVQAGLEELVADTEDDYVRIAVELAQDAPRLQLLRSSLRQRCVLCMLGARRRGESREVPSLGRHFRSVSVLRYVRHEPFGVCQVFANARNPWENSKKNRSINAASGILGEVAST